MPKIMITKGQVNYCHEVLSALVGEIRRKYGGSTADWTKIRKGDFVGTIQGKKIFRGWISGFIDDKRIISVSDFDWKRIVQFGESNVIQKRI